MIQDNTVEFIINELHGYEPILLKEAAVKKRLAAIEGKNRTTQKTKSWNKSGNGGGGWGPVVKIRPKCDNCGKHHDGICNKPLKAAFGDRLNSSGKPNWTKKEQMYVAQHIAQKVSEATAGGSNSEVEVHSNKRKPKWTKGLSTGTQMFCTALAQEDNYSDVEDANDDEIRDYRKQARRTAQQLKWNEVPLLRPRLLVLHHRKRDGSQDLLKPLLD